MSKHALAICKIFFMQLSLEIINLRCLQEMWSRLGAEWDKHLAIASLSVRVIMIRAKLVCLSITSKQAKVAPEHCQAIYVSI